MTANFEIEDMHILCYNGRNIDLHNNFNFHDLTYSISERLLIMTFTKINGDWIPKDEINKLKLVHSGMTYLFMDSNDPDASTEDAATLGDVGYYPSSDRETNDGFKTARIPEVGDDILYFFEDGRLIRINCESITLEIDY